MGGVPDMVFRLDLGGDSVRYAPPLKRGAADLIASRIPPGQIGTPPFAALPEQKQLGPLTGSAAEGGGVQSLTMPVKVPHILYYA